MGSIAMKDPKDHLAELAKDGQRGTPRYERLCMEILERREEKKERAVAHAWEVLHKLAPEAGQRGLKLGIENRDGLTELPIDSDLLLFFGEFADPAVCYWHDTGHAQVKEILGFIHHLLHLESNAGRLAGFHLHDVEFPDRDHRPPGKGTIDFAQLKPFVKPEHIKVFELSPSLSPEEVREGVAHLRSIWGEG